MPQTIRIPLVGPVNSRDGMTIATGNQDQFFKDCVFEVSDNSATQTKSVFVRGREAHASFLTTGSGASTAVLAWTGKSTSHVAYARGATNSNIYLYNGSTTSDLGAITGQGIHMAETDISGTPNFLVISGSGSGRTWFYPDGGSLTEITDTDFPPKQGTPIPLTGNFVPLNGRTYIMTTNGQIWAPEINSLSSWSALNFLTASQRPDGGVGAMRYKDMIVGFGTNSTEFFRDAGNPSGSQLTRIENSMINIGCINQHSMIEWNDTVAFIGNTGNSGIGVYVLDGFSAKKISPNYVDFFITELIQTLSSWPTISLRCYVFQSEGHQYLAIGSPDTEIMLAYVDQLGIWTYWRVHQGYKTSPYGIYNLYAAVGTNGIERNDATNRAAFEAVTAISDFGTAHYKSLIRGSVVGDSVGSVVLTTYWNDKANSVAKTMTMTSGRRPAYRLGRAREFQIGVSAAAAALAAQPRVQAVELEYEVGSH